MHVVPPPDTLLLNFNDNGYSIRQCGKVNSNGGICSGEVEVVLKMFPVEHEFEEVLTIIKEKSAKNAERGLERTVIASSQCPDWEQKTPDYKQKLDELKIPLYCY